MLLARSRGEPSVISLTAGNLAIMALDAGELETGGSAGPRIAGPSTGGRLPRDGLLGAHQQAVILLARGNLDQACAGASRGYRSGQVHPPYRDRRVHAFRGRHDRGDAPSADSSRDSLGCCGPTPRTRTAAEDPNVERLRAKWELRGRAEARRTDGWTAAQAAGAELSLDRKRSPSRPTQPNSRARHPLRACHDRQLTAATATPASGTSFACPRVHPSLEQPRLFVRSLQEEAFTCAATRCLPTPRPSWC